HATGIGDHANTAVHHRRQYALHRADEVAGIAERRVALPLLLQDGHGHFGQVVQHQVVDRPALDLALGGIQSVAPEALPRGHPNEIFHSASPWKPGVAELRANGTASADGSGSASWNGPR